MDRRHLLRMLNGAIAAALLASGAHARTAVAASFTTLPIPAPSLSPSAQARAISGDGQAVLLQQCWMVGAEERCKAHVWRDPVMTAIPGGNYQHPQGISADGRVVGGWIQAPTGFPRAFVSIDGVTTVPPAGATTAYLTKITDVAGDGTVTGRLLPSFWSCWRDGVFTDSSGCGEVISHDGQLSAQTYYHTSDGGIQYIAGVVLGPAVGQWHYAFSSGVGDPWWRPTVGDVSSAGVAVGGFWTGSSSPQIAFVFRAGTYSIYDPFPGSSGPNVLEAVSPDGDLAVGSAGGIASLWTVGGGFRPLQDELEASGVDTAGWLLRAAVGIADDGRTVVGHATDGDGNDHPFLATLDPPACSNGIDDDGDDFTDATDLGCRHADSESESPACNDGIDNDGDGAIDMSDLQCPTPWDPSEGVNCADGIDNDSDGRIDTADPGCADSAGLLEAPQCSDGFDNDGDGRIDWAGAPPVKPADGDCFSPSQGNEAPPRACGLGLLETALALAALVQLRRVRRWTAHPRGRYSR